MSTFRQQFNEFMKDVNTSIPAHIVTFNPKTQRAQVQVGIETVTKTGAVIPPIIIDDVLVKFSGGTQFMLIHQVNQGDEGWLHISQRNIDAWKQTGKVATNPSARFRAWQDSYFEIGVRPLATAITGFDNDGVRIQNRSGSQHVWVKGNGDIIADNGSAHVHVTNGGDVNIENGSGFIKLQPDGTVDINGVTFSPDGKMTSSTTMTVQDVLYDNGAISLVDHVHTGVVTGGSDTGKSK